MLFTTRLEPSVFTHVDAGDGTTGRALNLDSRKLTMNRKHLWSGLALGALALAVWGCGANGPTDPLTGRPQLRAGHDRDRL